MELGVTQGAIVVFSNSQSVIHLLKNDTYHSKTKHIIVKYHFFRNIIAQGHIMVEKIHVVDNPAVMVTKPFPISRLWHFLDLVGINSL